MAEDNIFATPRNHIVDFAFDQSVTDVFPDMIRRSVPGYEVVVSLLAVIAEKYYQPKTTIYDLGCSLGAATLAMHSRLGARVEKYIAIDSSAPMIDQCQKNLSSKLTIDKFIAHVEDIRLTNISNASVVVLNFTMQFLPPAERQQLLEKIYDGLKPGGVLILSEKTKEVDSNKNAILIDLYHQFKSANGYSDLEISQKRTALEKVMVLDTSKEIMYRLHAAQFSTIQQWYQCFNFISLFAVK